MLDLTLICWMSISHLDPLGSCSGAQYSGVTETDEQEENFNSLRGSYSRGRGWGGEDCPQGDSGRDGARAEGGNSNRSAPWPEEKRQNTN